MVVSIPHPYYPLGAIMPHFAPNTTATPSLVAVFLSGWAVLVLGTFIGIQRWRPTLPKVDKTLVVWFVLSGSTHLFFESHFVLNHATVAGSQHFFAQLWKEYSLSDSRYLTSDPFVLCMEAITIAWGPGCFYIAHQIMTDGPMRHPMTQLVSTGQLYGNFLYLGTSLFDLYYNEVHVCRPELFYFWGYFVFFNAIWIVIPLYTLVDSMRATYLVFASSKTKTKSL